MSPALLLALSLALGAPPPARAAAPETWDGVARVVAIGDVHGDYDRFVSLLRDLELIDSRNRWTGGRTHLVQTGDILDRGPHSRRVLDLLANLAPQARRAGGEVHQLVGNHEAMNVMGDLRYVSAGEYEAFRDGRSGERRDQLWQQHRSELDAAPPPDWKTDPAGYRKRWESEHPLGWIEHRLAFAPTGVYGRRIAEGSAAIRIDDTLFVHGGIGPGWVTTPLAELNRQVRSEMGETRSGPRHATGKDGPLWYRGLAEASEAELAAHVEEVCRRFGVRRIVVGHTVAPGAILPRFGGRVIQIDVGLASSYGGPRAALLIEKGSLFAWHEKRLLALPGEGEAERVAYLTRVLELAPDNAALAALIASIKQARVPAPASP